MNLYLKRCRSTELSFDMVLIVKILKKCSFVPEKLSSEEISFNFTFIKKDNPNSYISV